MKEGKSPEEVSLQARSPPQWKGRISHRDRTSVSQGSGTPGGRADRVHISFRLQTSGCTAISRGHSWLAAKPQGGQGGRAQMMTKGDPRVLVKYHSGQTGRQKPKGSERGKESKGPNVGEGQQ